MKKPLVSIVIPTYNRQQELLRLLDSIKASDYPLKALEIIVVDNANDANLEKTVKNILAQAKVITPGKNVFSNGARKLGTAASRGTYLFLLDDDNTLETHCMSALVEALEQHPELGVVGPVMLNGDTDRIWCAGGRLSRFGTPQYIHGGSRLTEVSLPPLIKDIEYFPNACLVRRKAIEAAPLDDKLFPHNWAETDFCLRVLAAGYKMATVSSALERHHIGYTGQLTRLGSDKTYDQTKSRLLFRRRHLPGLANWLAFWSVIFPVSTMLYFWHFLRAPDSTLHLANAYIRGTRDGLTASITPVAQ